MREGAFIQIRTNDDGSGDGLYFKTMGNVRPRPPHVGNRIQLNLGL
jgi:hypothetical protein